MYSKGKWLNTDVTLHHASGAEGCEIIPKCIVLGNLLVEAVFAVYFSTFLAPVFAYFVKGC